MLHFSFENPFTREISVSKDRLIFLFRLFNNQRAIRVIDGNNKISEKKKSEN